jgi:hypothetical protein
MIAENHYLIPIWRKRQYALEGKYLLVVTDLKAQENERVDPIIDRVAKLRTSLDAQIKEMKDSIALNEKKSNERIDTLKTDLNAKLLTVVNCTIPRKRIKSRVHPYLLMLTTYD